MKILLCIIDTLSSLPGRSKYSRIFSCPDGITPNSGLTGLSILYIYIYMYVCAYLKIQQPKLNEDLKFKKKNFYH